MDINDLAKCADSLNTLNKLLPNRKLMDVLKLLDRMGDKCLTVNVFEHRESDYLMTLPQAAKMLRTNYERMYKIAKDGLIPVCYTPGSSTKKVWYSDVKALPTSKESD